MARRRRRTRPTRPDPNWTPTFTVTAVLPLPHGKHTERSEAITQPMPPLGLQESES